MGSTKKKKTGAEASQQTPEPSDMTFESALEELEYIVQELERDDLTLNDALARFERGIYLMRTCDTHLNHARGKITELFRGKDGAFAEKVLGMSLDSFLNEEDTDD
jgi:exodeoxyribonuclease VII small subunit